LKFWGHRPNGEDDDEEAVEGISDPQRIAAARTRSLFAHCEGQPRDDCLSVRTGAARRVGQADRRGDFEAQVEQVFRNLKFAVEAAGGTMADIVKLNYYVAAELDQVSVPKMRPIRDRYINIDNPPASTFLVVARLSRPGWLIEIEAVAAIEG
jgi:enamine deaminase RidA (YjgF/YER057c/UK114 family)